MWQLASEPLPRLKNSFEWTWAKARDTLLHTVPVVLIVQLSLKLLDLMSHTIVLTGAPQTTGLDWSEKSLLPSVFETEVRPDFTPGSPQQQLFNPQWRQLSSEPTKMRPSLPKLDIEPPYQITDNGPANFFSASEFAALELERESAGSDISAEDSRPSQDSYDVENEVLSEFYDHSFAIHEAIPKSQLESGTNSGYTPGTPTYESSDDMFPLTPGTPGGIIRTPSQRRLSQAPRPKNLSDLDDIPNAAHLTSIHPQTMTVNLIVGILSISPARRVKTGVYYGRQRIVDLVEMTVGDDTKSSFSISMWLPREMRVNWKDGAQEKPEGARSVLRRNLKTLRTRDIVLLQNVALSSFRGKVHGQSLRGDVTKVDLLFRKKVDDDELQGVYSVQNLRMATGKDPQIMKVKRVRDYLMEFVSDNLGPAPPRRRTRSRTSLPDDTQ